MFKDKFIAEGTLKEMVTRIRRVAVEVFGVTRGNKCESKDTYDQLEEKCYKRLHHYMSDKNIQKYKKI
jgi:hypothetical protein